MPQLILIHFNASYYCVKQYGYTEVKNVWSEEKKRFSLKMKL